MIHSVAIVALSKYSDIFEGFTANVQKFAPDFDKVLVRDGRLIEAAPGWMMVDGPEEFNVSLNANLGLKAVDPEADIVYMGDDARFTQYNTVERLRAMAYSQATIGLVSARVIGGADNPLQTNPPQDKELVYSDRYFALAICTYIKREVLDKVGYMDSDTFKGYGWDDVDYCRRVRQAGFKLAVATKVEVTHGVGGRNCTETFFRNEKGFYSAIQKQADLNESLYLKKWGNIEDFDKRLKG